MNYIELQEAQKIIYSLNLDPIIYRLSHVYKWSRKDAREAVEQYRNYIFLRKKYFPQDFPPSQDIDEVWHAHILHTKDYINFCQQVFGSYFHHNPGSEDTAVFAEQFERETQELYNKEFGDYIYAIRPIPLIINLKRMLKKLKNKAVFILPH